MITHKVFSKRQKKQGIILFYSVFSFFLLAASLGFFISASAQDVVSQRTPTVAEEQDYAFAYGLYRDSLFQLAGQQFQAFVSKYPNSIKRQDAAFLSAECLFQSSQFQNAVTRYNEFIQQYPISRYVPVAYLKLGQSRIHLKKNSEAIKAFKTVLEKYGESERAGEAAYWIGEVYLRNDDTQNALKYYMLASEDLPKTEKISFENIEVAKCTKMKSIGDEHYEREMMGLNVKRHDDLKVELNTYSGMVQAGIGSYFTPETELLFGQSLPNFQYSLGGTYHLTNGFAQYTDQSGGSFTAAGRTYLISNEPLIQNAALDGRFGYQSESFRFYGSKTPDLQRTISDFQLKVGIENQATSNLPYSIGIFLDNIDVSDSSTSANETRFDLDLQTTLSVASLPLQTKFHGMTASGGLGFMDVSGGIQNYWYAGLLFEGSLHMYWAKGMAGQNLFRLHPHLMVSYPVTSQHSVYVSYKPAVIPTTLASDIRVNRFLSTVSPIRHADVSNSGELGVESDWNESLRSRIYLGVKSVSDLTVFSDTSRQGIWMSVYGGDVTAITFCAEMVAKFESNDYFASNIMLRSIKDSFHGKQIPYFPSIEAECSASHRFKTAIVVSANVKFVGEQQADFIGGSKVSGYTTIGVNSEYAPLEFLKLLVGIKNLTDVRYETWKGYREFPLTMYIAVQVKW